MASELDTRHLDRRQPDAVLVSTFSHGDARDLSPAPLNGTLKNSPTFSDGSISIQNSGSNVTSSTLIGVEYPIAAKTTKQWEKTSLSVWIYPENEGNGGIYGKRTPACMMYSSANSFATWSGHWTFPLQSGGKPWFCRRYGTSEQNYYVNGGGYSLNTWQHLVVTLDSVARVCRFYLNGVLKTTSSAFVGNGSINGAGCEIRLGAQFFNSSLTEGFKGKLSKFMLWEGRVLTQAEVTELFSQGRT